MLWPPHHKLYRQNVTAQLFKWMLYLFLSWLYDIRAWGHFYKFPFPLQNITGRCTPTNASIPNCEVEFIQNPVGDQTVLRVSPCTAIAHIILTHFNLFMLHPPPNGQNEPLSNAVQIAPQAVSLRVRPGEIAIDAMLNLLPLNSQIDVFPTSGIPK